MKSYLDHDKQIILSRRYVTKLLAANTVAEALDVARGISVDLKLIDFDSYIEDCVRELEALGDYLSDHEDFRTTIKSRIKDSCIGTLLTDSEIEELEREREEEREHVAGCINIYHAGLL